MAKEDYKGIWVFAEQQNGVLNSAVLEILAKSQELKAHTGEEITAQAKTATPYTTQQTVLPDAGYDYLSQVTVEAIAYVETDNPAGGKTATIGTVAA